MASPSSLVSAIAANGRQVPPPPLLPGAFSNHTELLGDLSYFRVADGGRVLERFLSPPAGHRGNPACFRREPPFVAPSSPAVADYQIVPPGSFEACCLAAPARPNSTTPPVALQRRWRSPTAAPAQSVKATLSEGGGGSSASGGASRGNGTSDGNRGSGSNGLMADPDSAKSDAATMGERANGSWRDSLAASCLAPFMPPWRLADLSDEALDWLWSFTYHSRVGTTGLLYRERCCAWSSTLGFTGFLNPLVSTDVRGGDFYGELTAEIDAASHRVYANRNAYAQVIHNRRLRFGREPPRGVFRRPKEMSVDDFLSSLWNATGPWRRVLNVGAGDGVTDDLVHNLVADLEVGGASLAVERDERRCVEHSANLPHVALACMEVTPRLLVRLARDHWRRLGGTVHVDVVKIDVDSFDCDLAEALLQEPWLSVRVLVLEVNSAVPPPVGFAARYRPGAAFVDLDMGFIEPGADRTPRATSGAPVYGCSLSHQVRAFGEHGFDLVHFHLGDAVFLRRDVPVDPWLSTAEAQQRAARQQQKVAAYPSLDEFEIYASQRIGAAVPGKTLRRWFFELEDPEEVFEEVLQWLLAWRHMMAKATGTPLEALYGFDLFLPQGHDGEPERRATA
eukprot:TRINITY_DN33108_c0_g1_i1.p1 TRINITY_DN33108_c0_g1~~TRINITY_DN33108_c0_g1_i1.p1  ORF type:complete len:622 (-),score=119.05 TRINITY_DN33108_c0_g1_i1:8-1873(-)